MPSRDHNPNIWKSSNVKEIIIKSNHFSIFSLLKLVDFSKHIKYLQKINNNDTIIQHFLEIQISAGAESLLEL